MCVPSWGATQSWFRMCCTKRNTSAARRSTGHIAAALFAARQLRVREAKSELERAFVTNPADNAFVDLGWCLWLGLDIDAPTARWNDLHDELVAPPSRALAVALRALAQHHASGRAEQLRALAQRSDRPVV